MDDGIWMQWKHWATDESWSKAVQLFSAQEALRLGQRRPALAKMEFQDTGLPMLDWLGRLEAWCAASLAGSPYLGLGREFSWLRNAIHHKLPGVYDPGTQVDLIVSELRELSHATPGVCSPGLRHRELPEDIIPQLILEQMCPSSPMTQLSASKASPIQPRARPSNPERPCQDVSSSWPHRAARQNTTRNCLSL